MLETSANSLEGREVVRCSGCLLNQFMTRSTICRRPGCKKSLLPAAEIPADVMILPDVVATESITGLRLDLALIALRVCLERSQKQFASVSRISKNNINRLERGRGLPTLAMVSRLAAAFNLSPRQLIEFATV